MELFVHPKIGHYVESIYVNMDLNQVTNSYRSGHSVRSPCLTFSPIQQSASYRILDLKNDINVCSEEILFIDRVNLFHST